MAEETTMRAGPLAGVRVLDFGRYVAGPYCASLLADFGADVIRIERPGGGEDRGIAPVTDEGDGALYFQINRNKRSLTLDPRAAGAEEIRRRLIASADIVVVNVPDSALAKMGLDLEALRAIREDIILVNVSSFGPKGPWADRPGFAAVAQAMCGSAWLTGAGDVPYRTPISWVDHATGLYAAFGAMVALHERGSSGRGQQVGGSLLGSALAISSYYLIEQAMRGTDRTAIGNRSHLNGPTDTYRTTDGWIATQGVGPHIFSRWAELVGEPELVEDPRFATDQLRGENGAILSAKMQEWCSQRSTAEALDMLAGASIPAGPVLSLREALDHPQVAGMEMFVPTEVPGSAQPAPLCRAPVDLGETPASIYRPPPRAGADSDAILAGLDFSEAEIAALREQGTV